MKKAKIMLFSIAVLAVVGGALAFKATKRIPLTSYCTGLVKNVCPNGIETINPFKLSAQHIFYTPTFNTLACPQAPECTFTGTTDFEVE